MTALLIVLTVLLVVIVLAVLATYLVAIARSLRRTAGHLGNVSFGVRAIEAQTAPIGPGVTRINEQLSGISAALAALTGLARSAGNGAGVDGGR
jgi:hypothetical protein